MAESRAFRLVFRTTLVSALFTLFMVLGGCVQAESVSQLLITEVQTQSATSKTEEFIEIYNPTDQDVNLQTFQIKYLSAAGSVSVMTPNPTAQNTVLKGRGFLLLSQANYALASDATFTTGLSDTGGHIQISLGGAVVDTVGWGTAAAPETKPAVVAAKGSTISRVEVGGVYQDSNNNFVDFHETTPTPQGGGLVEQLPDLCPNLADVQEEVPIGYELDQSGNCIIPKICTLEVSEISAQPNSNGQEYVELKNSSTQNMWANLCKLKINGGTERVLPEVEIVPGQFYLASFSSGTIRNSAGEVTLIDSNLQSVSYSYPETLAGETVNFDSTTTQGVLSAMPTPGSQNILLIPSEEEAGSGAGTTTSAAALAECPAGKYRNPATNRCKNYETAVATLQPCDEDQERNPETNRCRKITSASSTPTACKAGQERNPDTNRCRNITTAAASLKPCEPGQERNPSTNRCRKVAASIEGTPSASPEQAMSGLRRPLAFSLKIVLLILACVLAYGIYEYRTDIRNFIERIRSRSQVERPPD